MLVQKAEALTRTAKGILIPEKSVAKVLTGKVVAVGEGARTEVSFTCYCCCNVIIIAVLMIFCSVIVLDEISILKVWFAC